MNADIGIMNPYTEEQWRAVERLGRRVDGELQALDVRLTQGGEPTFVLAAGGDAPEWNYAADGPTKRALAERLLRRLRARFAPCGLMFFGQGKWYPGEPLPRWALSLFWRPDGAPLWNDAALVAGQANEAPAGGDDARRLIESLAAALGLETDRILPAYEDPWPALEAESRLPPDVDPLREDLRSAGERARLARLLRQGLAGVAGYVLPLHAARRASAAEPVAWHSARWTLRRERLYLVPGDSALGYRLPLDTLPSEDSTIRTALCVEAREGRVRVFIPPLERTEDYLALVAAIERCARRLGMPVVPEGYEPPLADGQLQVLRVTPDPGVIEVNVQPAADWRELSAITAAVYEEARGLGLIARKFLRDGRPAGTGGGGHITLGGRTPADSPWLRRPDLLASLIRFWQNHPALSYLFSGQYIGPTSQAPRVDEARHDSLHELEIAFQQLARLQPSEAPDPHRIDGLLRNLLVDVAGNTHRAEFCVDKLASPDGPAGRLGLLELRAFETAPHERMALVQYLLVRALVAMLRRSPCRRPFTRWGPALHDRFMLPHFLALDMREVVAALNEAGLAFEFEWLQPFMEWRFPLCGGTRCGTIELELRHALEPWPVLGESAAPGSASRTVDASTDRVQVLTTGMDPARHVLVCNGRRVPLQPAGATGVHVAGVRYRARRLPLMLQPSIGVHAPLRFEVVETSSRRSLGGCTYHAGDPSGRAYERPPRDAAEAEARRRARFVPHPASAGPFEVPPDEPPGDMPCTLDLRHRPEPPA